MAVFAYGTLMAPAVMQAVCGRCHRHASATLPGFARFVVRGATYPAIVPSRGARTEGLVYFGVHPRSLARIDVYEDAMYQRRRVRVESNGTSVSAMVYVIAARFLHEVTDRAWSFERFCSTHLESLLAELRADVAGS